MGQPPPSEMRKTPTGMVGVRVPMMVKWPGHIPAGQVSNDIVSLQDWLPTLMAAAGETQYQGQAALSMAK